LALGYLSVFVSNFYSGFGASICHHITIAKSALVSSSIWLQNELQTFGLHREPSRSWRHSRPWLCYYRSAGICFLFYNISRKCVYI